MVAPTGTQYVISRAGYEATITEGGASLRALTYQGRPLIDGFAVDEFPTSGKGQLLMPWANRIGDGRYVFDDRSYQLPLSEPGRQNASHGLVRWVSWSLGAHTSERVDLHYRLMAQSGYPWTLALHVSFEVSARGLCVSQTATNLASSPAPYVAGAHPYLRVGDRVDDLELTVPAATRMLTDERKLPTGLTPVEGTDYDFRIPRVIGSTEWDHAVTDLARGEDDKTWVTLRDPSAGTGVALWADGRYPWLQIYTADDAPAINRRALAVEPMTGPPDAFRTGTDVIRLSAAGFSGDTVTSTWGVVALGG